jgi:zinc D-Ala-D-Ala carboxypeptidase
MSVIPAKRPVVDWSQYPNFMEGEFRCRHTGECVMQPAFLARLQALRTAYGRPMVITSGYRHPTHPVEARKAAPGAHSQGRAADIAVHGADALRLIVLAAEHGFTGIGVQQKGAARFIHLDDLQAPAWPRPTVWSY